MIDGDGGDQCRISNLSKEQIQFSSAVSQVVMYCCGAVPRIEFWIWLNIDVEKLLENEWQHNKRPLAC
jgi:hypothetical protein